MEVVHKNVSQGCHEIRKSEIKKATKPLLRVKVVLCDLKSYFILRKSYIFKILVGIQLINEYAGKNLAERASFNLS